MGDGRHGPGSAPRGRRSNVTYGELIGGHELDVEAAGELVPEAEEAPGAASEPREGRAERGAGARRRPGRGTP